MKAKAAAKRRKKLMTDEVLRFKAHSVSRSTVRRYYAQWRQQQGIPPRCDIKACRFHTNPLKWSGKDGSEQQLPLILDHDNGVKFDNRPSNLRHLCPNCDSLQATTRGGANRGRVQEVAEGRFVLVQNGRREYFLLLEAAHLGLTGYAPSVAIAPLIVPK